MLHAKIIDIKIEKIEVDKAENFISSSKFGASLIFKGTVRENNVNKKVIGITYDSHDVMVIKSFEETSTILNEFFLKISLAQSFNSSLFITFKFFINHPFLINF